MRARAILSSGADLLKKQGKVCIGQLALDKKGNPCDPHLRRAVVVDAPGALYRITKTPLKHTADDRDLMAALAGLDLASGLLYKRGIVATNDNLGLEAVIACYRRAWAEAKSD